ncbi:MAG: serine/threonine-protein kinase [Deltaproteobacteria bacterium]|nr:serine/threonine-protein kinase [Deltaproteobacteria bacterium]
MSTDGNSPGGRPSGPMFAESLGPGVVLGETYEITRLIGRGGMGAVWEAKHLRLPGRFVAIKVLLGGGGSAEILSRFRREVEIASRLGHPNIVEAIDFNTLPDGTPYQVLERLLGESLGERLRRGPIALAETMALVRQIASGLAAAHREGIVHRDLKPENIFLCPPPDDSPIPRVKILDFGISKMRGAQTFKTQESVVMGTPQYMSPEQASGNNQAVDERTDVFALGAIVYEMLSGHMAFAGDNVLTVMVQVMQGQPTPLQQVMPSLPASVVAAVEAALQKDLAKRCPNVAAFVQALTGRPLDARTGPVPAAPGFAVGDALAATLPPEAAAGLSAVAHTQAPRAPAAPTAKVKRTGPGVLLALVGACALTAGAFFFLKGSVHAPPAPVDPTTVAAPPPAATPPAPAPVAPLAPAPAVVAPAFSKPPPAATGSSSRPGREVVPPEVAAELAEAEALLAAGQTKEAARKAKHSLFGAKTSRAYKVLTRAACAEGDLTNARAAFLNVARAERKSVVAACLKSGLDLQ